MRSIKGLASILFAILYGASPIDLIPDVIPLLGQLDDALIVPLLLVMGILQMRRARHTAPAPNRNGVIIHPPRR